MYNDNCLTERTFRLLGNVVGIMFALFVVLLLSGCATPVQTVGLVAGVATATGSYSPDHEIEQIYYLGVFDPQEQIPSAIYRVRVHGQASFLSNTHFASGWAPAQLVDSLNTQISSNPDDQNKLTLTAGDKYLSDLKTGRRLVMFGPEGFREAPRDHRLVIVMGASPDKFFEAMDTALADISQTQMTSQNFTLQKTLFAQLIEAQQAHDSVQALQSEVYQDIPKQ